MVACPGGGVPFCFVHGRDESVMHHPGRVWSRNGALPQNLVQHVLPFDSPWLVPAPGGRRYLDESPLHIMTRGPSPSSPERPDEGRFGGVEHSMEAAKQVLGPRFEAFRLFAQALELLLDFRY